MMKTAKEIALMLAERCESVATHLLPDGKRVGNAWKAGSVAGESGESLSICLSGDKAGVFCDFATGDSGDLLNLWALNRNITLLEAMKQGSQWLGIASQEFMPQMIPKFVKPPLNNLDLVTPNSLVQKYLMQQRKLSLDTIKIFKVGESQNEIVFNYFRGKELIFVKYLSLTRVNDKKQIRVIKDCEPCLFGWHTLPAYTRQVTLCEGEIDAMSLYQYGFPALSVPFGGGSGRKQQWLEYEYERLAVFDKIYLCFDNDVQGHAAVDELAKRLGRHRCYIVTLPHKDANACLQAGMSKAEIQACFDMARNDDPKELKSAHVFVEQVINEFYTKSDDEIGMSLPWLKAKGKISLRPDELSVWTGINGHGKSQMLGQILLHALKQGAKVCVASLELKPRRLLTRLTRQAAGLANPTIEYIRAIHHWYQGRLWLFDLVGNAKSEHLLEVFTYAKKRYGVDVFVIDSMMKLDIDEEDFKAQKAFIGKLCDFKHEYNCHVHLVVHPRKGIDETKCPGKLDVKGSGSITDLADNCFIVWRNKSKEDQLQKILIAGKKPDDELLGKVDALLICDKQRNGEWEGRIGLWFDGKSFQYLNQPDQKIMQYVDYSKYDTTSEGMKYD